MTEPEQEMAKQVTREVYNALRRLADAGNYIAKKTLVELRYVTPEGEMYATAVRHARGEMFAEQEGCVEK